MIQISKIEKDSVKCCTSCHRDNKAIDNYEIIIGKTIASTVTIRLCSDCIKELISKIDIEK